MRQSTRLSDAIHILTYIKICESSDLSSSSISRSIETNPAVVRRLMAQLKKAKLLISKTGASVPRLSRPAEEITLLEVYLAVEENHAFIRVNPKTNPACLIGGTIQDTLGHYFQQVQQAAERELAAYSLADVISGIIELGEERHLV